MPDQLPSKSRSISARNGRALSRAGPWTKVDCHASFWGRGTRHFGEDMMVRFSLPVAAALLVAQTGHAQTAPTAASTSDQYREQGRGRARAAQGGASDRAAREERDRLHRRRHGRDHADRGPHPPGPEGRRRRRLVRAGHGPAPAHRARQDLLARQPSRRLGPVRHRDPGREQDLERRHRHRSAARPGDCASGRGY